MLTRRVLFLLLFATFILAFGVFIRSAPDWEWIVTNEQFFRHRVDANPLATWLVGVVAYFVFSMVPGTVGKSVVCGWLFGFWAAALMVEIGLTAAALLSFLIGRLLVQEWLSQRWQPRLQILSRRFAAGGGMYLLMLRLAHAPFTLVNYGAGAIQVPISTFTWTTLLGILPGTIVFTFAGSRVPSLALVTKKGIGALIDLPLLVALLATFLLPLVLKALLRWISPHINGNLGEQRRENKSESGTSQNKEPTQCPR